VASSATPSVTPKPPAPQTVTPAFTGPVKVALTMGKLPTGSEPRIPYLVGREVRGGGDPVKIPGTGDIFGIARLKSSVFALVTRGADSDLLKIDGGNVRTTPGVGTLVTTADQTAAAYAVTTRAKDGTTAEGGIVRAESGGSVKSLKVTDGWSLYVLAYAGGKVYFGVAVSLESSETKLYSWSPADAKATLVKTTAKTMALTSDGATAASRVLSDNSGDCFTITTMATGKRLWKTCDNYLTAFTPDGAVVIGGPPRTDANCTPSQVVLDAKSGRLLREWTGCFRTTVAEDDEHLLTVAIASGAGEEKGVRSAIIRCAISTGACELATPIRTDVHLDLS
jgi:hypothetical protein